MYFGNRNTAEPAANDFGETTRQAHARATRPATEPQNTVIHR